MKKILTLMVIIVMLFTNISFATSQTEEDEVYIESYDDYLNMINGQDEQAMYKEYYLEYLAEQIKSYDETKRDETVKARVIEVKNTKEYYSYDDYGLYKIKYQPITIEILEGEQKEKKHEVSYILTIDPYENIDVKPVKENQIVNVVLQEEKGEIYPYITTVDSSISRVKNTIILLVITILLMFIFLGTKAFKILPQLILLADIIILIFVPELLMGRSIIWLTLITAILYLITDTVIKVGINSKTVASLITTFAVIIVTTIGLNIFNSISTISGITYGITPMIEVFPKGTIDFYNLNMAAYILIALITVSDIANKVINIYDKSAEKETRLHIKEYVSSKILTTSGILLITAIPNYLYVLISKYTFVEMINSEILTNEVVKILFLIISMLITTEVAILAKKFLVKQ